jgi:glutathione S-transferase
MMVFDNTMRPGAQHDAELAVGGRRDFSVRADILSKVLSDRDYLLASGFSGADILVGHSCFVATVTGLIEGYTELEAYYDRLQQRPGYRRALGHSPTSTASDLIGA